MKQRAIFASLCAFLLASTPAWANTLQVNISNVQDRKGVIMCGLYNKAENFPLGKRVADKFSKISNGRSSCTFKNLKPGIYAIAVIHDENGNKIMDTNAFKIPKEGFGFSNNLRPRLRLPKFEKAAIKVSQGGASLSISMQYF